MFGCVFSSSFLSIMILEYIFKRVKYTFSVLFLFLFLSFVDYLRVPAKKFIV